MKNDDLLSAEERAEEESLLGRKAVTNVKRVTAEEAARFKAGVQSDEAETEEEKVIREKNAADKAAQEALVAADGAKLHVIDRQGKVNTHTAHAQELAIRWCSSLPHSRSGLQSSPLQWGRGGRRRWLPAGLPAGGDAVAAPMLARSPWTCQQAVC